jgi:hypothetical protein
MGWLPGRNLCRQKLQITNVYVILLLQPGGQRFRAASDFRVAAILKRFSRDPEEWSALPHVFFLRANGIAEVSRDCL